MNKIHRYAVVLVLVFGFSLSTSFLASAQQVGHLDYKMGRKSIVSVTNTYGPITVEGADAKDVQVVYTSYAKSVTFDNQRHGNRVSLVSLSDHSGDNLAEYTVLVPSHAWLTLFAGGPIHVTGLAGDITIQTMNHPVEIKNITGAYIHVKTLDGSVTLTAVRNSHVNIQSINGSINISDAPGSWVEASSTGGRITYEGDPGVDGDFHLTSHSGDVDASIPASALVEIQTNGVSDQNSENLPETLRRNRLFLSPRTISKARFELRSFMGKVRLKRPDLH